MNGFLSIEEQIKLLESKKFIIPSNIKDILNEVNYYTLMSFKNIFYINGIEHNYKSDINFIYFYMLYNYDILIKQKLMKKFLLLKNNYTNIISDYFSNNFNEDGYLNKHLYKKNIILKIYKNKLENNLEIKKYYKEHNFLPIWVLLNSLSFCELVDYILDFKDDIVDREIFIFCNYVFNKIISCEKVYDVKYKDYNLNDILILFIKNNISINDLLNIYCEIVNRIPCISYDDIYRETRIKLGGNNI